MGTFPAIPAGQLILCFLSKKKGKVVSGSDHFMSLIGPDVSGALAMFFSSEHPYGDEGDRSVGETE